MRYRKKPVEVEAVRWTGDNADEMSAWMGADFDVLDPADATDDPDQTATIFVDANSRWLGIVTGEWVIRDRLGFYPCKAEMFEVAYERVDG